MNSAERPRRVLVVDDVGPCLVEMRELLEGAGHRMIGAAGVTDALRRLQAEPFDLVILEAPLAPDEAFDGLERLKQHPDEDDWLPVLVTTVRDEASFRVEGLRRGADDVLSRPFDGRELLARAGALLRQKAIHDRIIAARDELERLSFLDSLTGLYNKRWLQHRLREEYMRARRYRNDLSVVVLDIDHFKQVNDTWGHLVGDDVLREVGALLREHVRETDAVGRYGGEEFVMLLPHTGPEGAASVLDRLRQEMARRSFGAPNASLSVTISAGIASLPDDRLDSAEALLGAADEALYLAKRAGRDRVCRHAA